MPVDDCLLSTHSLHNVNLSEISCQNIQIGIRNQATLVPRNLTENSNFAINSDGKKSSCPFQHLRKPMLNEGHLHKLAWQIDCRPEIRQLVGWQPLVAWHRRVWALNCAAAGRRRSALTSNGRRTTPPTDALELSASLPVTRSRYLATSANNLKVKISIKKFNKWSN